MKNRMLGVLVFCVLLMPGSANPQDTYYLPQVANGSYGSGSFRTTFLLFNNANTSAAVSLALTTDTGDPLKVTIPGLGTGSAFNFNLAVGESRLLQTDGSGSLAAGAATVAATAGIGVSSIFTIYDANGHFVTESGVGNSQPSTDCVIPVDVTGDFNTGLALFGSGGSTATVTFILRNASGAEAGRTSKILNSNAHLAIFVAGPGQLFPAVSNFRGTLEVRSSTPISALTLRQNSAPLSYTSLPVVPAAQIPDLRGNWEVQVQTYSFENTKDPGDVAVFSDASSVRMYVSVENNYVFAGWLGEEADKMTGAISADGTIFLQTNDGNSRTFVQGKLISLGNQMTMTGVFYGYEDLALATTPSMQSGSFTARKQP